MFPVIFLDYVSRHPSSATILNTKRKLGDVTMNLERVPNEEKLQLCRKYYLGGFALLPFLWLVNVTWFFQEAFCKPVYSEQPQIKSYVKRSALGLLVWLAVLATWIGIYQTHRAAWGATGDYLSFTIPLGIP